MGKGQSSVGNKTATDGDTDNGTPRDNRPGKQPLPTRTETEIAKHSELGSDQSGGQDP
ncbi:MAG: hypothetical protein QOJ96_2431 [Alphaproteobacteria bacterium]|jgi:hypothetical protein|nr:hypothetical protein [Alphaproteobacteria bacterium]